MTQEEARALLEGLLAPLPLADFRATVEASRPAHVQSGASHPRAQLLGPDPKATILAGYASHATILDSHAVAPTGPVPEARAIDSPQAFAALIERFHANGHTVRVPGIPALAPTLARITRAIEAVFTVPADASLFWSADKARAKVHYDDNDIIVVQLTGTKRWFVADAPSPLGNVWKDAAEGPTLLGEHTVIELTPGDLLYVPRGTPHTVESSGECLHATITFTPHTFRAALIAAIDRASDGDRRLRSVAPTPPGPMMGQALTMLAEQWRTPHFLETAEAHRVSRMVGRLPALPRVAPPAAPLAPETRVRHTPLALIHLLPRGERIDVAIPGGHVFVHAGAGEALAHIAATSAFRIADLPGVTPDVAVALVERLMAGGVLKVDG